MNTPIDIIRSVRRLRLPVRAVRIGEVIASVSVKMVTSEPTAAIGTERSADIFGSKGAIMKLSVPMAKVPRARKKTGFNDPVPVEDDMVSFLPGANEK